MATHQTLILDDEVDREQHAARVYRTATAVDLVDRNPTLMTLPKGEALAAILAVLDADRAVRDLTNAHGA